ncbi:MAG: hypothetical protein KW804_02860 [Candidatus Doudnabacteria bacterium]|nr:hypothetical protein [Candidatus Doudnabacteria bacterium]
MFFILKKLFKIVLYLVIIVLIVAGYFYFQFKPSQNPGFGVTFSHIYAASLGFDARVMYMDMLTDLKPKKVRLVAYWDEIEAERGKFKYDDLDFMLTEAQKRGVEIMLVVGKKVPRWPECHQPGWYKDLPADQQSTALLGMIKNTINHFKHYDNIKSWQVENEPYFVFGIDCPKQDPEMLLKEVKAVREIDNRPIVLTASGEQGNWNQLADSGADVVGVTMYRTVYNDTIGYYKYPVGPWFYRIKAGILKQFKNKPVIGVELQTEPWLLSGIFHTDIEQQKSLMNEKVFNEHVIYAKKVGFQDNYLWGVEWWYWMAKEKNDWTMWATAKKIFADQK